MANRSVFERGAGVFACIVCQRRTRGNKDSAQLTLCGQCYELAGEDNQHNDDGTVPDSVERIRYDKLLAEIVAKGGDEARVRDMNSYIFEQELGK